MASKAKKCDAIRNRKTKPNAANQKKHRERIERNRERLRELAAKDAS